MLRLFEICDQPRPLAVADREGQPVLRLQRGARVTDQLVEELNQLIGDDYYQPGRHDMAQWFASLIDGCLPTSQQPAGSPPDCDGPRAVAKQALTRALGHSPARAAACESTPPNA